MPAKKNKVIIIGRPNTGKSTLFNTIIHEKKAITSAIAGTTRDIISTECEWNGKNFSLVDTAGLTEKTKTELENNIQLQAEVAIKNADVIIFVVDIRTGPTSQEINIAKNLRQQTKPVILVINKAEGTKWRQDASLFNNFGLDSVVVSSIKGMGVGDLLDKISSFLQSGHKLTSNKENVIKVGIFGKPNAGKSSLINKIIGEEKNIVSEIPGTTRDAVDIKINYQGQDIIFYDTAGIRRRTKIKSEIDKFSIARSFRVIKEVDIAILLLDVNENITKQDLKIASRLNDENKGVVIIANKWDLALKKKEDLSDEELLEKYIRYYQHYLKFLYWAPIIFTSAKTGLNVNEIIPIVISIAEQRNKVVEQTELDEFLKKTYVKNPPPRLKRKKNPEIKKFMQIGANPPAFKVKIKEEDTIKQNYIKYIEKELRKTFDFNGTSIKIIVSSK